MIFLEIGEPFVSRTRNTNDMGFVQSEFKYDLLGLFLTEQIVKVNKRKIISQKPA